MQGRACGRGASLPPQLHTLRPPSLGLRVKFQPLHVTRHGRCRRPAPLSCGPPDGSSLRGPHTPDAGQRRGACLGQTLCPQTRRRVASPSLRGNLSPGILGNPRLSHIGTRWPTLDGSCGRGLGAGQFRRGPGVSWTSQPAAGVSGFGEPRPRCTASSRAQP